jgi:group I intron endonuclease
VGGIYIIENTLNGRFYVGSAASFKRRWQTHRGHLRRNKHGNRFLQNDWNKCGEQHFRFMEYEPVASRDVMLDRERQYLLLFFDNQRLCYNIRPAPNTPGYTGRPCSPEARAKISAANTGRIVTEAHRLALSESHKGYRMPPAQRAKIAEAHRKIPRTEQWRRRISAANKGRRNGPLSSETRAKLSDAHAKTVNATLIAPDGSEHFVERHIRNFARKHGLMEAHIAAVIRGARKSHRGWRLKVHDVDHANVPVEPDRVRHADGSCA